jgi:glutaconate CoA-transferase subunit B
VITDLAVLEPDAQSCELVLTQIHPGVEVDKVREETGWDLKVSDALETTDPATEEELAALRELLER